MGPGWRLRPRTVAPQASIMTPASGMLWATSIPVSCGGVKTHVFMNTLSAVRRDTTIFWRRQGTVFVDGKLAGGARFAIQAPCSHMSLERGLERRKQLLKLVEGQAGEIQELCGTSLHID